MDVYQKIDYQWGISNILINLGSENCVRKNYSLSGKFLEQALQLKIELEDQEGRAIVLHHLAKLYLSKAEGAEVDKKNSFFRKAEEAGLESYSIAERIGTIPVMKDACGILKEIYEKQGRYSSALQFSETFNSLNDSLLNRAKIEALTFAEARWNVEKKQQEIDNLENTRKLQQEIILRKDAETRQQRSIIWFIVSLFILTLISVYVIALYLRKRRDSLHQKQLANISILKMQNLRNALSPHFLFNVLNNLWAIMDNKEKARSQFNNLVNLIRRSLMNTENLVIPLNDEIDFVRSFIELQKLRMNNDLDVKWNIENGIDMNQVVPGMILQIPVENAIKHGLAPKIDNRKLEIDIKMESGFLKMNIADNGSGIQNSSSPTTGTGTGLRVLTNTIQMLNQINVKKMSYEMLNRMEEGEEGTKFVIKIPLLYNYNLN